MVDDPAPAPYAHVADAPVPDAPVPEAPAVILTYRHIDRSGTKIGKFKNGMQRDILKAAPEGETVEPYVHDPVVGLAEARSRVADKIPLQVRASMQSYCTKLMIQAGQGNQDAIATYQFHLPRFAALDVWEEGMIEAGKNNTEWPAPPEWLDEYMKEF